MPWKVGDVVKLKSGGPKMTVERESKTHPGYAVCQWFDGTKMEQGRFPHASLEKGGDVDAMTNAR